MKFVSKKFVNMKLGNRNFVEFVNRKNIEEEVVLERVFA
jgi:hypothetical protein